MFCTSIPNFLPVPKFTVRSIFSTGGSLGFFRSRNCDLSAPKSCDALLLAAAILTSPQLGARPRGCTATQGSKKGSEKVLGRVLGKGSSRERLNRALVIVLWSRPFLRLRNAFKNSVFEAPKLVTTTKKNPITKARLPPSRSQEGSEKGACYLFYSKKKGVLRWGFSEGGFQKGPRTSPRRVRPLRRAPYSDGHRTRLPLGGGWRRTSEKFCSFLELYFLPLLRSRKRLRHVRS